MTQPAEAALSGVLVRPERPDDVAAVRRVIEAAFGRADEADLVDALRSDPAWLGGLALVAVPDGGPADAVVGYLACSRLDVDGGDGVALAPVAVLPSWQGRGVGGALVSSCLARAAESGESLVVVLGEPSYYGRFGFQPAGGLGVVGPFDGAGDAFQARALRDGAPRGTVRYAPPFGV